MVYTSKLLISKHQQVQLLEAASVLVTMNQDGTTPPRLCKGLPERPGLGISSGFRLLRAAGPCELCRYHSPAARKRNMFKRIALGPTLAGTREYSSGQGYYPYLLPAIPFTLAVLPRVLVSVTTVNRATSVAPCRRVSTRTKKTTASQLLSSSSLAASGVQPQERSRSLFQRMLLLCHTSPNDI